MLAVNKSSQYLVGRSFIVKTDQKALKFLLEQKLHTSTQLKWITKLIQFNFEIEYKKGKKNKAVEALSRPPLINLTAMTLSPMKTDLLELIMKSWDKDEELIAMIQTLKEKGAKINNYTCIHGQLRRK